MRGPRWLFTEPSLKQITIWYRVLPEFWIGATPWAHDFDLLTGILRLGRLSLIQAALSHDESDLEGSLDRWVKEISEHYTKRAQWWIELNPPPEPEPDATDEAETTGVTAR